MEISSKDYDHQSWKNLNTLAGHLDSNVIYCETVFQAANMETSRGWGRTHGHTGSLRQAAGEETCASLGPFTSFAFFPFIYGNVCCPQDSISQKSLDIQSRSDDQHSISSADRFNTENHRQSPYTSASGIGEDNSRSRTPTSKNVTPHKCCPTWTRVSSRTSACVFHRGPWAAPVRCAADQMCGAAGADPDDRQHRVFPCHQ